MKKKKIMGAIKFAILLLIDYNKINKEVILDGNNKR